MVTSPAAMLRRTPLLQRLRTPGSMMAAAANTNEEGKVQFEKFEPGGELARTRTIYIAPAADALFGFNRQRVIGGDVEIDGLTNSAPITLEIVYTIVN